MAKWFYYSESGKKIEVTGGELKGLAKMGRITPETIVETEDGKTARAGKVKGLTFAEATPTETPPFAEPTDAQNPEPNTTEVAKIGWMSSYNALKTSSQQGSPEAMFFLGYFSLYALGIGFWDIIKNKYSMMNGRARRKELWMFSLWYALIAYVPMFIGFVLLDSGELEVIGGLLVFVGIIFSLALLCPMINLQIRRLHDIGKSGWFWLISFIPYVGGIILLVLMCLDSQRGDNQYGPNPKGEY